MKTPQQTFTRNGITITFPVGYTDVEAYARTLNINVSFMKQHVAKKPKYAAWIERDEAELKNIEKALA